MAKKNTPLDPFLDLTWNDLQKWVMEMLDVLTNKPIVQKGNRP
ncbi:MAG: hypothetical protein R6U29_05610 [Desulfosudaceae bacterium]